jgi:isoleucyl-tRNA synthetase
MRELFNFCNDELGAFYFDVRKDTLYCDPLNSHNRLCYLTVLNMLFRAVVNWLKPVLVFTAEEAWQARGYTESVHLSTAPRVIGFSDDTLEKQFAVAKQYRDELNENVDRLVKAGDVKGPGDVRLTLRVPPEDLAVLEAVDFKSMCLLAELDLGPALTLSKTSNLKCERCWRREPSVQEPEMLCTRCLEVVGE